MIGNEPAMPKFIMDEQGNMVSVGGLTIRQHFAAMAMQGIMANPDMTNDVSALIKEGKLNIHSGKDVFAFIAVQSADALIEELNKE